MFSTRSIGFTPWRRSSSSTGTCPALGLVSPRLREEFGNGEEFYARRGERIAVPERAGDRPHREFLEWHLDTVFKAA